MQSIEPAESPMSHVCVSAGVVCTVDHIRQCIAGGKSPLPPQSSSGEGGLTHNSREVSLSFTYKTKSCHTI